MEHGSSHFIVEIYTGIIMWVKQCHAYHPPVISRNRFYKPFPNGSFMALFLYCFNPHYKFPLRQWVAALGPSQEDLHLILQRRTFGLREPAQFRSPLVHIAGVYTHAQQICFCNPMHICRLESNSVDISDIQNIVQSIYIYNIYIYIYIYI